MGLVLAVAASTLSAQVLPPGSFHDDFETDRGWVLFEEIVGGNTCYGDSIGTLSRSTAQAYSPQRSLELWANHAHSLKSNHVLAYNRVASAGRNGKWRYSTRVFISPDTPLYQTGPEFSMQNTRRISPGVFSTYTAAVQYQASPWLPQPGSWTVWAQVAPGVASWVPLGYQPLEKGQWYTLAIDADYDSNRYLLFTIVGPGVNQSFSLTDYLIAGESKFDEETFDITVEGENLWNNCGTAGVYDYKSYYDDVDLSPSPIPSFESVAPSSGTANGDLFTFIFKQDPSRPIEIANVLVAQYLDGRGACYLAYHRPSNVLYLVNDAGTALLPGMVLNGSPGTLSNNQCTIAGGSSSAVLSGNQLTLKLDATFGLFYPYDRIIFAAARDGQGGNSGWRVGGVWRVPVTPPATAILQNSNGGSQRRQVFNLIYRHHSSAAVFTNVQLLINRDLHGVGACWVGLDVSSQALYLLADDGSTLLPALTLGSPQTRENSQCRIHGSTSSSTLSGTDRALNLDVEFKTIFLRHLLYGNATAASSSDWITWTRIGTWSASYP